MIYRGAPNPSKTVLYPRVSSTEPLDSLFLSGSSQSFMGSRSMLTFEDVNGSKSSKRSFLCSFNGNNIVSDEYDEYFNQPEKKRRLTVDQIEFLEKSFEIDNKLEPERKVQLAKDLGLQPRQVAIWFQNRRARYKTKQVEKDYDVLLSSYNNLKADYEGLLKEKEKLNAEVLHLSEKLLLQQKEKTNSAQSDTDKRPNSPQQGPTDESASEGESLKNLAEGYKLEDISSNILESDSPHYIDASYVFEPDHSDLSQDEEDNLSKNMIGPSVYVFPNMEDDESTFPCFYEFPVEDQVIENWPY